MTPSWVGTIIVTMIDQQQGVAAPEAQLGEGEPGQLDGRAPPRR